MERKRDNEGLVLGKGYGLIEALGNSAGDLGGGKGLGPRLCLALAGLGVEPGELLLFGARWGANHGWVIENGIHAVVILLRDRIRFTIVAAGTFEGDAEPDHTEGADAISHIFDEVFFVDDAVLGIDGVSRPKPVAMRCSRAGLSGKSPANGSATKRSWKRS
jgi:hypothetical protein